MAERSVSVRLAANVTAYQAAMGRAAASTKALGSEIAGLGKVNESVGRVLAPLGKAGLVVGAGVAAGFGLAAKAAVDFESAFAGVTKTVDGTAAEMDALRSGILAMSKELPASTTEIASVAEAAGALGIKKDSILSFTRTMVDLGETTNLTADDAATAMARIANIMQTPQSEIDRLGATLVALGNNGASTEAEIVQMATRIASAGKQIGLTEGEVLGFANALSSVGIEAEAGGSAISRVMIETRNAVMDGGDALDVLAETADVSADQFAVSFRDNAGLAIIDFIDGLGRMEAQGRNSNDVLTELGFADIRVGNALRAAAASGDLFRESLELGNDAYAENTALTDEAAKRYETTGAQIEIAANNVKALAIELGDALMPALRGAAGFTRDLASGVSELPDPLLKAGAGLTAMFGALSLTGGAALTLAPAHPAPHRGWAPRSSDNPTGHRRASG